MALITLDSKYPGLLELDCQESVGDEAFLELDIKTLVKRRFKIFPGQTCLLCLRHFHVLRHNHLQY